MHQIHQSKQEHKSPNAPTPYAAILVGWKIRASNSPETRRMNQPLQLTCWAWVYISDLMLVEQSVADNCRLNGSTYWWRHPTNILCSWSGRLWSCNKKSYCIWSLGDLCPDLCWIDTWCFYPLTIRPIPTRPSRGDCGWSPPTHPLIQPRHC